MGLGQITTVYTVTMQVFIAFLALVLVWRLVDILHFSKERNWIKWTRNVRFPEVLKLLFGLSMALTLFYSLPFAIIGSAFRQFIPAYLNWSLIVLTAFVCIIEIILAFTASAVLRRSVVKKVMLTVVIAALLPLSIYFAIYVPDLFTYPETEQCHLISLPTKGEWIAGHAGGSEIVNYHCAYPDQVYAMDVSKLGPNGKTFMNDGDAISDHFTLNEPVYAPVDGVIVHVIDSLDNAGISFLPNDTANPAGNHVVIQFKEESYLFLAHLQKGSSRVNVGDHVHTGDLLASAGNSGNTSWPHLHLHIQDKPHIDFQHAKGQAYRFKRMERVRWFSWQNVRDAFLLRNDRFRPVNQE